MFKNRSYCGELKLEDVGKDVQLAGWVDAKRDLGGIIFIEMRDVTGLMQLVFDESNSKENAEIANKLKSEYVIQVHGKVRERSEETKNIDIYTGNLEIVVDSVEILNESLVPPFPIDSRETPGEEIRLKYRFLDLRREDMKNTIINRHKLMQTTRTYLVENRFFEIETPILNKSTPEGARDFLVPSRINKGQFYALPQSPQLFKQILMVAGFDRYFQIVKCFRDEDLRNDRQPEFTQIDMELSFVTIDMIMEICEGMMQSITKELTGRDVSVPFNRMTYDEAMSKYGTDAPDLRIKLELKDCSDIFQKSDFNVFKSAFSSGGVVKGIAVNDEGKLSRKMTDDYNDYVKNYGAKGFPMFRFKDGKFEGGIAKFIKEDEQKALIERFNLSGQSTVFFSVDNIDVVNNTLAAMRVKIARDLAMVDESEFCFTWVTDFPLMEYHEDDRRYYSCHHPFTSPQDGHFEKLNSITPENVGEIKAKAYDIVLNGAEIGGGSIRISNPEVQQKVFEKLGISEEEANEKFSFLLNALKFGAPPHGGIAFGVDRILMKLLNRDSIRDVIPFPKTQKGQCMMSNAPSEIDAEQLKELGIKAAKK